MIELLLPSLIFIVQGRFQYINWPATGFQPLNSTIQGREAIYLGLFFPVALQGDYFLFLTDLALQEINSDALTLPDYVLYVGVVSDTSAFLSDTGFSEALQQFSNYNTSLVGILGDSFSAIAIPEASVATVFQMPQISASATSPLLSDKTQFPYFLRLCGSEVNQAYALAALIKKYGWERIGTLNSRADPYGQLMDIFFKEASRNGINVIVAESFEANQVNSTGVQLKSLENSGAKIILLVMNTNEFFGIFTKIQKTSDFPYLNRSDIVWIGNDGWIGFDYPGIDVSGVIGTGGSLGPETDRKEKIVSAFLNSYPEKGWNSILF
eukprot:TRINITY_DN8352_c0_g1_i2.p2 TRINITY_DN8352_c0_g1~~TRINITY_DN8352_c0_g1_i2.p2  ORF type:complete len:324 (-),score=47.47 TRINITY_DN8352_c0_g1_i2:1177-2148(-)